MAATRPSGTLKAFLDTKKADTRLLGSIERHLLTRDLDTSRRTDVLHPSELIKNDFCTRAAYFKLNGAVVEPDRPNLRLQNIFEEGHSIHDKWQTWIWQMGNLYGRWECLPCGGNWWGLSPTTCPDCASSLLRYREVPLVDNSLRIAGHADGWVVGLGDPFLIEIKSIGTGTIRMEQPALLSSNDGDLSKAWRDIRRPFPSHLRQGQFYLELLRRMKESGNYFQDQEIPTEIVFLYELKADQSYKEFVVKADAVVVKDSLDTAYDVVHAVSVGQPPKCPNNPDKGCKACAQFQEEA